jgi:hypothetical protein
MLHREQYGPKTQARQPQSPIQNLEQRDKHTQDASIGARVLEASRLLGFELTIEAIHQYLILPCVLYS